MLLSEPLSLFYPLWILAPQAPHKGILWIYNIKYIIHLQIGLETTNLVNRIKNSPARAGEFRNSTCYSASLSSASISISSPVAMNTARSQMFVTRSAARSRLWFTHMISLVWSMIEGSAIISLTSER